MSSESLLPCRDYVLYVMLCFICLKIMGARTRIQVILIPRKCLNSLQCLPALALLETQVQCRPPLWRSTFCLLVHNTLPTGSDDGNVPPPSPQLPHSFRSCHRGKAMLLYACQGEYCCLCWSLSMGQSPWLLGWDSASLLSLLLEDPSHKSQAYLSGLDSSCSPWMSWQ